MRKISIICFLAFSGLKSFAQTYCSPAYPNGCVVSNNRITKVQIGTIDHSPPDCVVHDYTSISTQATVGVPMPLTVISEGWCCVGAAIDLNNDGDFDDANEVQALPAYIANQVATYNMTITIPPSTPAGGHRLRVYNRLGNSGTGTPQGSPCGIYAYGSWDDYTLYSGLNLGPDTAICEGNILTLNANPGFAYLWSTGATTQTIDVTAGGTYYVTISNGSEIFSDTIQVAINPLPIITLPDSFELVNGTSITLNAGNPGANYLWNTGGTSQLLSVNAAGYYWVTVTDSKGCQSTDTTKISLKTVGIDNIVKNNAAFTITPNPANQSLYINITDDKLLHTNAIFTDASGRILKSISIENKYQFVSLVGLVPGMYVIKLENGLAVKLVKEQ